MDAVTWKWFVSGLLLPPAGPLLLAVVGAVLVSRRGPARGAGARGAGTRAAGWRRVGGPLLWGGLVLAWMLSITPVSGVLLGWVEGDESGLDTARLAREMRGPRPPGAIVVLAGGITHDPRERPDTERPGALSLERLESGAWIARQTGLPMMVSGGTPPRRERSEALAMARSLERSFGLRARWVEARSRDTADNAMRSAELLREARIGRIVLVTHAYHMRRAAAAFEAAGLEVIRAPMGFMGDAVVEGPGSFVPSPQGIRASWLASHEAVGWLWYRLRGHL